MSFLLLLCCLLVLLTNKPTSGATCKQTSANHLSRLTATAMDTGGNKRSALSCERAFVRARSLTSSRLYNTVINTYTIGWYNRIIRSLLVLYVHNTYKVTILNRSHIIMYKEKESYRLHLRINPQEKNANGKTIIVLWS